MSNQPDNPPAFPETYSCTASGSPQYVQDSCAYIRSRGGMTLRDWFAGQALVGTLASYPPGESPSDAKLAEWSYATADAMLAARNQEARP
jgi:hypothetical protein